VPASELRPVAGPSAPAPIPPSAISPAAFAATISPSQLPITEEPGANTANLGSILNRFVAMLIDWAIFFPAFLVIGVVVSVIGMFLPVIGSLFGLAFSAVLTVIAWLYYAKFESSPQQATLGKRIMGVVVTDLNGQRLSFRQATIRFLTKIPSILICGVGYIMALFTPRRQGLHDILAKTLVLNGRHMPVGIPYLWQAPLIPSFSEPAGQAGGSPPTGIPCPNCRMPNPAGATVCGNCRQPLG
jgi:uncharacterized RDD family membrane protein YckC